MQLNQKILSVILIAVATAIGFLYVSSDNSFLNGEDGYAVKQLTPCPQVQISGKIVCTGRGASQQSSSQDESMGIAEAPNSDVVISQDRPASLSSAPLIRNASFSRGGGSYASNRRAEGSTHQIGGATFSNASSRSGSSSARYASSSFSSSSLASNSLETNLNGSSTRSSAPAATTATTGGFDPGGNPTNPAIPVSDGTAILMSLAAGYAYWKFRKVKTT